MQFRLESPVQNVKSIVKTYIKDFRADTYKEESMTFDNGQITGAVRELQLNGFCLIIQDLQVHQHCTLKLSADSSFFKFHFELEGEHKYTLLDDGLSEISMMKNHFNLFYIPGTGVTIDIKASPRKTLEVLFTEDFITKAVGNDYKALSHTLRTGIKRKRFFKLWQESKTIPVELQGHLKEIIDCRYCGHIKKIYLEARITALLLKFLVEEEPATLEDGSKNLSKSDYTGLERVEEHIQKNFQKTITIAELAPIAGLNTTKLKESFKKVYGITIFKFITRLRMEKARDLICSKNFSVAEASNYVGYKNPQHFTVAFKKYYGFLPRSLTSTK